MTKKLKYYTKEETKSRILEELRKVGGESSKIHIQKTININFYTIDNFLNELADEGKIVLIKYTAGQQRMTQCILKKLHDFKENIKSEKIIK